MIKIEDIIIVGAGGFGREVEWLIERINMNSVQKKWNILGFADDNLEKGQKVGNTEVICNVGELSENDKKVNVVIAIGNCHIRENIYHKLKTNSKILFPNLIDPSAIVDNKVSLGIGNIICAGTIATVNINMGNFNIINLSGTLGHDLHMKNFVTVYPHVSISGTVNIDDLVEIGTGTQIIQGLNITHDVIIGAGTVVIRDILESGTYVGVPSKKIK